MIPRYYQSEAVDAVFNYYITGNIGNPLVALPTGTGKSLVNTLILQEVIKRYEGQRVLCLTHVKELIEQNYAALIRCWPTAPAGIYSASVGRKDIGFPITFAGIGSIYKKAMVFQKTTVIVVDEAHLIGPKSNSMYGAFIADLKKYNPHLIVIGMTATPYRMGQGRLTEGDKPLFTDICYDRTTMHEFNRFIDEGYMTMLIPLQTKAELDVDGLRINSGEYSIKQMQERYNVDKITRQAIEESIVNATERKHWLIFATGVEHCENIAAMMSGVYGIACEAVHSKMSKAQREATLAKFTSGELQAVVNNNCLTTGFDYSGIDLIIILRPTNSPGLWVQILGRGTRPVWPEVDGFNWDLWPEGAVESGRYDLGTIEGRLLCIKQGPKPECLVMDFAANSARLGPINDPVIPSPPKKNKLKRDAPVRICENCGMYNHASVPTCKACGFIFPRTVKIRSEASQDDLIKRQQFDIRVLKVTSVEYSLYEKVGKPTQIKATYFCGLTSFNVWLGFDHDQYTASKARKWWRMTTGVSDKDLTPQTVEEAYRGIESIRKPEYLRVRLDCKYPELMDYDFDGSKFGNVK